MRRPLVVLGAMLAACSSGAGPGTQQPAPTGPPVIVSGLSKPEPTDSIDGWRFLERAQETLDLGVRTRFERRDGLQADTWVYPVPWPDAVCPLECIADWIGSEADEFRDLIPEQLLQAGYFARMDLIVDDTLELGDPALTAARHIRFEVENEAGRVGTTEYLLVGGRGYRMKVRVTDFNERGAFEASREVFREYVREVAWPYTCQIGQASDELGVVLETTVAAEGARLVTIVDSVMEAGGPELKAIDANWTSTPQFAWPAGTDEETWHGRFSPGYQVLIMAEARGDSVAFSVQAPAVCDIGDHGTVDGEPFLSTLQILVATEMMNRITEALGVSVRQ